jgi:hypothetical protein
MLKTLIGIRRLLCDRINEGLVLLFFFLLVGDSPTEDFFVLASAEVAKPAFGLGKWQYGQ